MTRAEKAWRDSNRFGSEVKVALILLESNSKRNIFWENGIICVCCNMEMTSQGDNREIKDSLLTKIHKTSKGKATISQRKTVAQTRLRGHHYYGFDTEYWSFRSSFFLKTQDTQLEQFYSFSPHAIWLLQCEWIHMQWRINTSLIFFSCLNNSV